MANDTNLTHTETTSAMLHTQVGHMHLAFCCVLSVNAAFKLLPAPWPDICIYGPPRGDRGNESKNSALFVGLGRTRHPGSYQAPGKLLHIVGCDAEASQLLLCSLLQRKPVLVTKN